MVVCGNDAIAWPCVTLLRSRGVRVPQDICVAGFDDTLESFLNGLTSYNFNSEGAAQGMLNHILAPPRGPTRGRRQRVAEVPGFVSLRATTGRP
jgi:LacI family transcriptional regulator